MRFVWTIHALERMKQRGISRTEIKDCIKKYMAKNVQQARESDVHLQREWLCNRHHRQKLWEFTKGGNK